MANILLIEPDRMLGCSYAKLLEATGHMVQVCTTAQAGIEAADETCPDVVVLELQLIGHSGVEFLYEFRSYADWQTVPVVVMSKVPPAEFNQSVRTLKEYLGISAYCYKPQVDLGRLLHAITNALVGEQLKVV